MTYIWNWGGEKRSALVRIAAAWIITVPASAIMAAVLFFTIRGMMLP